MSVALLFALVSVPAADAHGLMNLPPAWQTMGGRLGVMAGGYANEGGIDRWYTDNTFIPGTPTIPHDSPLRTYENTTLDSILRWGLLSVLFDKIHTQNLADHVNASTEAQQVKDLLGDDLTWTLQDVSDAQVRIAMFFPDADPYGFFGLARNVSASELLSMKKANNVALSTPEDVWGSRPWRAPGSAHVESPCGVFGGNFHGCPGVGIDPVFYPFGNCPGGGSSYGPKGETLEFPNVIVTAWQPGAVVEVGWSVSANHGGGYSYRLCKLAEGGKPALTEKCFQSTPLPFVGNTSWIQYTNDTSGRVPFAALRTTEGTTPSGSHWTKNPVPPCRGADGGLSEPGLYNDKTDKCVPQFAPPVPGILGFGIHEFPKFAIIDQVKVPTDLQPGKYVLSHRWDCEQTMQIWTSCSDVNIAVV